MRNYLLLCCGVGAAAVFAACSGGKGSSSEGSGGSGGASSGAGGKGGGEIITVGAGGNTPGGLVVKPPMITLDVKNPGPALKQAFKAYDGNTAINATWTLDAAGFGTIDATGTFTTSGQRGGVLHVIAAAGGKSAEALVTVDLEVTVNPGMLGPTTITALDGGGNADAAYRWLYPYDNTLWPRGLKPPVLQFAGTAGDGYLVEITEPHLKFKGYYGASSPSRVPFQQSDWDVITKSAAANDSVDVKVTKTSGGQVTGPLKESWTIAQGSLKGSVYYNTYDPIQGQGGMYNGQGAIMRVPVGSDVVLFKREDGRCTVCHSLSARGNVMVAAVDLSDYGGAFDVTQPMAPLIGPKQQAMLYAFGGLSPQGDVLVTGNGDYNSGPSALYDAKTGSQLFDMQGKLGIQAFRPAFSPDGKKLVFTKYEPGKVSNNFVGTTVTIADYDANTHTLSNPVDVFTDPDGLVPAYAIITPDGESVILDRGTEPQAETRNNAKSDLWSIDIASKQATKLAAASGYDKAGNLYLPYGMNEAQLNFEPTMLPVTAGGFFWVVFTSRRNYGNFITSPDPYQWGSSMTPARKKLWVTPVDAHAKPGQDSSHPSIYLDGQDLVTANMRGFWSLDPCRADGMTCETGDECCGGACRQQPDGSFTCGPVMGCAQESEMCKTSGDCCNPSDQCIAGYCATIAPPPK